MFDAFLTKLRFTVSPRRGRRPRRVSILLPFLIISLGLGALAWRSYNLSVTMERGASELAQQYVGYVADITARRVDGAVAGELTGVAEEWQQMERRFPGPTFASLRQWVTKHDWILFAVYVPDYDPASGVYVSEVSDSAKQRPRMSKEFYTSTGTVKYDYDPQRLLTALQRTARQQRLLSIEPRGTRAPRVSDIAIVRVTAPEKPEKVADGFAFTAKLAAPFNGFGVRAVVRTEFASGHGWQNPRTTSLWLSLLAVILTASGVLLAIRGINKESETMKLRGALIANVSHELRTPLSMIRLGAETLKRGKLRDHERTGIQDQILHEVLLLSHLVENVLDVARIQNQSSKALAFTPVGPRDLIRNLVSTYESWIQSKGFTVAQHLDETVEEQMWDRDSVSRALLNLIDNAIKYSGEENRAIDIVLRQTAEHVIIEVKDHGLGIEPKDAAKIFEPYYRARFSDTHTRRGAGLGLTLVQQILESHGGRVELESIPGNGSTFRLMFPRGLSGAPQEVPALRTSEAF
jgi:signal transduction histidine kinase